MKKKSIDMIYKVLWFILCKNVFISVVWLLMIPGIISYQLDKYELPESLVLIICLSSLLVVFKIIVFIENKVCSLESTTLKKSSQDL